MNKLLLLFFFILFCGAGRLSAQINLVPNPSFELYDTCPGTFVTNYFDNYLQDWKCFGGSPEYFNSCAVGYGVPNNIAGYQAAAMGNAYAGVYTFESSAPDVREFVGVNLISPLSIGVKYYVRFKISLAIDDDGSSDFNYATNNMGARFSMNQYSLNSSAPINNQAHVFEATIISDTSLWTVISGSFIADSAYQYIAIGNFFTDSATSIMEIQDTLYDKSAYYYVDDVYVSTDSFSSIETYSQNEVLNIFPNPANEYFEIKYNEGSESAAVLTLYNSLGEIAAEEKIYFSDGRYIGSRKGLRSGLYMLKVESGDEVYCRRIIFQ